jgi:hypothetical protein
MGDASCGRDRSLAHLSTGQPRCGISQNSSRGPRSALRVLRRQSLSPSRHVAGQFDICAVAAPPGTKPQNAERREGDLLASRRATPVRADDSIEPAMQQVPLLLRHSSRPQRSFPYVVRGDDEFCFFRPRGPFNITNSSRAAERATHHRTSRILLSCPVLFCGECCIGSSSRGRVNATGQRAANDVPSAAAVGASFYALPGPRTRRADTAARRRPSWSPSVPLLVRPGGGAGHIHHPWVRWVPIGRKARVVLADNFGGNVALARMPDMYS